MAKSKMKSRLNVNSMSGVLYLCMLDIFTTTKRYFRIKIYEMY